MSGRPFLENPIPEPEVIQTLLLSLGALLEVDNVEGDHEFLDGPNFRVFGEVGTSKDVSFPKEIELFPITLTKRPYNRSP